MLGTQPSTAALASLGTLQYRIIRDTKLLKSASNYYLEHISYVGVLE